MNAVKHMPSTEAEALALQRDRAGTTTQVRVGNYTHTHTWSANGRQLTIETDDDKIIIRFNELDREVFHQSRHGMTSFSYTPDGKLKRVVGTNTICETTSIAMLTILVK